MQLPRWPEQLLLFCLIPIIQAYHVFDTNYTIPSILANYISSPNTRGTLDILWSSLFTILAYTWTLQHPNVPEQRNGRDPGLLGDIKWGLNGLYRSVLRMVWTTIAPEVIITVACINMDLTREHHNKMQKWVKDGKGSWSLTHSYYATMGGFVLRRRAKPAGEINYYDLYHLSPKEINALLEGGHIDKLPDITEAEIKDKSKGDMLVKAIAVGQILWSIIQISGRAVRRLPVSPLEVAVVAFAVCAVFIYGAFWYKPQRIGIATTIKLKETSLTEAGAISDEVLDLLKSVHTIQPLSGIGSAKALPGAPISLDSNEHGAKRWTQLALGFGATVFGSIHIAAWNFAFPSRTELIFWRCASIYTATVPLCIMLLGMVKQELTDKHKVKQFTGNVVFGFVVVLTAFFYIIARLFILVEMFRTLCFLPPDSYVSTWTSNIPHVA
ncbi:hypothetical protein Trihar35433_4739 [Trichoderma harzianum]|nr:hypothetical protein Trihar35433_4739 [Trichoderma harzianum]